MDLPWRIHLAGRCTRGVENRSSMNSTRPGAKASGLIALLFSRLLLFAFFQGVIALLLQSWKVSEAYWLHTATLTNIVSIILLVVLFKREGVRYLSIFRINQRERRKDILVFLGLVLLSIPLVLAPSLLLSQLLWGDSTYYHQLLFRPIPVYHVYLLMVAFPVTIALAELAIYFGYILPRLKQQMKTGWLAVLLPVLFLSAQHCTMPLIFDAKFILLRGLMYLPFAAMLGIALNKRPTLLPYLAVLHGLLDAMTVMMMLVEGN
jgi:membrane protease YdiL (CAAX protease family)